MKSVIMDSAHFLALADKTKYSYSGAHFFDVVSLESFA